MSKARKLVKNENRKENNKAIIYCRVSSDRQKSEGHGLESQEQRCRAYALANGLEVEKVFHDSASGGGDFMKRPAMLSLLEYIDKNAHRGNYVVIFDDLSRYSRDLEFHLKLNSTFKARGVERRCLNYAFDDSPEGHFAEVIMAANNQLDREKNRRQVIQKQKARLERGYWGFGSKRGYEMKKDAVHGKLLTPLEPDASILREALEGFANGRFLHKVDACSFLVEKGFWKNQKPERYIDKFTLIAKDPLYAGYIEYPMWEVARRKGHHEAIISLEVHDAIQKRLRQDSRGKRVRRDISEDFPLRGLLVCDCCGKPLTGAISSGRSAKYPYYRCQNKECDFGKTSINADEVHSSFDELLSKQGLKKDVSKVLNEIFDRTWNHELNSITEGESRKQKQIDELQDKLAQVTELAVNAKSQKVRVVYEKQIEGYAEQIAEFEDNSVGDIDFDVPYRTALEKATTLLESPYKIWHSVDVREQRQLFFFIFEERLAYSKKAGYRTDKLPSATRIFEDFVTSNSQDVEMAGVEPASELGCGGESTCVVTL